MSNNHQVSFANKGGQWLTDGKPAQAHKLSFAKKSGPHFVKFRIDDENGRYAFVQSDPIWVKTDDGECPSAPSSHPDIAVKRCDPDTLTIENRNDTACDLRYQLNVFDHKDQRNLPIDPIMTNGGNGRV